MTPRHRAGTVEAWDGTWAAEALGVVVTTTTAPVGLTLHDLVGMAVRRNPRRAQLLVSHVLGKHVPVDPRVVRGAGLLLGDLVRDALSGSARDLRPLGRALRRATAGRRVDDSTTRSSPPVDGVCVLGFAETATALGHCVADSLGAPYLHSTRRPVHGIDPVGHFEEEHSHATTHLLLPADPSVLDVDTLVLVDDELSTGRTARNTIAALHALRPRSRYVVATLVDLRSPQDTAALEAFAAEIGARVEVVALAAGTLTVPEDVADRGARALTRALQPTELGSTQGRTPARRVRLSWPSDVPEGARHGWDDDDRRRLDEVLPGLAAELAAALTPPPHAAARVLVLGTEELMYVPMRLACALVDTLQGAWDVRFSSTTRSPVLTVDDPGYAIRSALAFAAHDDPADGPGRRFAYNVTSCAPDAVVLVLDADADSDALAAPGGLLDQLGGTVRDVLVVTLPGAAAALATDRTKEPR
ncbi:phosphoribosyltransferase family protein [Cellulomonas sp. URHD0024]|uniref:phosphoribosyltransferase family protein n=1 Tax=Cellulomonas sp. URHD0024 TaxID=1302620 RepID=UPI000424F730|nr:phosphoribosyltransferase family protein [Cellulomonas sp. URHD0024]